MNPNPISIERYREQAGARIDMAGIPFFPMWTGPLNILARLKNRAYNAPIAELCAPCSHVVAACTGVQWQNPQWGMGHIASGTQREDTP